MKIVDHEDYFKDCQQEKATKARSEKRKENSKRPVKFTIKVKVKMRVGSFEAPMLLDSRVQDCSIDKAYVRSKSLKLTELPEYLPQHTRNANNMLSMQ